MKKLKFFAVMAFALTIAMPVVFTSCSEKDDPTPVVKKPDVRDEVLGTWKGFKFEFITAGGTMGEDQLHGKFTDGEGNPLDEVGEANLFTRIKTQYEFVCEKIDGEYSLTLRIATSTAGYVDIPGTLYFIKDKDESMYFNGEFYMDELQIGGINPDLYSEQWIQYDVENDVIAIKFKDIMFGGTMDVKIYYKIGGEPTPNPSDVETLSNTTIRPLNAEVAL